jgi:hypothetical protein
MRPRSIRGPSSSRSAGRTVTDPTTAQATTAIVALAIPLKTFVPAMKSPASAIITVVPETITVRPEVRAVCSSAASASRPRRRSSRMRVT